MLNNFQIPVYINPQNGFVAPQAPATNQVYVAPQNYANILNSYPAQYYTYNLNQEGILAAPPEIKQKSDTGKWELIDVEKTPYGENIYKYRLQNGQIVALAPKKDATVIVKTFIDAGSMNENDKNRGISHFNEHNVFNGSKKIAPGTFFGEVGKFGGSTNASTDFAKTDFYIQSSITDFPTLNKMIEMHADMLTNPLFPEDMVEKEKGPVTSEISMCNDDTTNIALNSLIKNLFQINSNSSDLVAGSIETVNNITRDDVYNHWKNHFTPDNMYTVLSGDFNPNEAIEIISQNFNMQPDENAEAKRTKETLTPLQKSTRVDYISPNDASTSVLIGFAGPKASDSKEAAALDALTLLLFNDSSSRLKKDLTSMYSSGIFYTQKVGLKKDDPLAILCQFSAQKGDDSKVIDTFYNSIKNLETNPPTQEEMQIIKNCLLKYRSESYEDSVAIADTIGTSLLDGNFNDISENKKIIENLTPQDIVNVAKKYFDFDKMSVAVVHPYDTTQEEIQNNYNKSIYAKKNSSLSFKGAHPSTKRVEQMSLSDNSTLTLSNSNTENCYLDWRLTSKETIPENPACAYVLTQILNDGTKNKSKEDFKYDASKNSVSFDVDTNGFQIRAYADCLYTNTKDAINTLKQALYEPNFTEEEFQAAVKKIETYCNSMSKDASVNLLAQLYGKYFPSPKQITEGLKTLTLNDVKKHYNNLIFNSSSNVVITAPIQKHPELKNEIINEMPTSNVKFKPYSPKLLNSYAPNEKATVLVDTEERNQAQIYKNYSFEISGNIEDEIKFELLNTILGGSPNSRLFQDLREKQKLAYTTSSNIQSFENSGILTLNILSTTDDKKQNDIKYDNLQKCLDGFEAHTNKLMTEHVTDEELESAKMALKQKIASQLELSYGRTMLLSMNMTQPYGIKRIDEYINTIDKITKEDIKEAANHVFSNKPVYSILASADTIANNTEYINNLGEVVNI